MPGPVQIQDLPVAIGTSINFGFAWIAAQDGYPISGSVATATFRQSPQDTPLLVVTSTAPTANGSIINFLAPIPDFPWIPPPWLGLPPQSITLYPGQLIVAIADVDALIYPSCAWKLNLTWSPILAYDLYQGLVDVKSV